MNNAQWYEKLNAAMPWGSGTSSKHANLVPEEPAVLLRGKGCRVWDADGKEYIDFRNGLGPITLGYCYDEVDQAIMAQMKNGISFSYPTPLEYEVAKRVLALRPQFGMVKFLKSGGEACAGAIRLARAYTGRDHIIQVGYNGWLNVLASTAKALPNASGGSAQAGVPAALGALHHTANYGDMDSVRAAVAACEGGVAAIVVAAGYPNFQQGNPFYKQLRALCDELGALLVLDEIVTGFRCALGGVSEYFDFESDLSVYAKGFANGMPLSALAGRKEVMALCDMGGGVSISSTYAGETLSLAAAKTVIDIFKRENVVDFLWKTGETLWSQVNALFKQYGLPLGYKGAWPCAFLTVDEGADGAVMRDFLRAACANGVLLYACSYVNFSHKAADVAETLERLEKAMKACAK